MAHHDPSAQIAGSRALERAATGAVLALAFVLSALLFGSVSKAALHALSLAIFVWHLPIFTVVARHTGDWDWLTRSVLGTAILVAVVVLTHRWVEEPTRRWLATHLRAPEPPDQPTEPTAAPALHPKTAAVPGAGR